MALYPDVQKNVQRELDRVVGADRLPSFDDAGALPYVEAVLMECARWIPVAPLGVPHTVAEDDFYKAHFIPQGAVIWAVSFLLCSTAASRRELTQT